MEQDFDSQARAIRQVRLGHPEHIETGLEIFASLKTPLVPDALRALAGVVASRTLLSLSGRLKFEVYSAAKAVLERSGSSGVDALIGEARSYDSHVARHAIDVLVPSTQFGRKLAFEMTPAQILRLAAAAEEYLFHWQIKGGEDVRNVESVLKYLVETKKNLQSKENF